MSVGRIYTLAACALLVLAPPLCANDLSEYRGFDLDADLAGVARQAGGTAADANILHTRPALIRELSWRTGIGDSVNKIVFGFYDRQLFRIVVSYDRYNTEGLTLGDMTDAISVEYGPATAPSVDILLPSLYDDSEIVKVLARWEDPKWSFKLVRSKYQSSFSLVALSKRLDPLAQTAIVEAHRLDRDEAPRRERDRQTNEENERLLQNETARSMNRADFRP